MNKQAAFTLIEVLIALAIVMALMALSYPSYANYLTRTRRTEGQIALMEALQQQERYFSSHNRYIAFSSGSTDADERRFKWWSGNTAKASAYELRGAPCAGQSIADCIELRATPGTASVNANYKDPACLTLILLSTGERSATGKEPNCWP